MAGHSKWNNIKQRKGKEDSKRAATFTKLGRFIMVAARDGGADPEYNSALKAAIDKAKAENMPNDNIERAIKKGAGGMDGENFESIHYEGYGPAGTAFIVDCLTDNRNRTAADVRHLFEKSGGNMGQTGSVSFMFDRKGILYLERGDIAEDTILEEVIEAGADDVIVYDDVYEILTDPTEFANVYKALGEKYHFEEAKIGYIPQNTVTVDEENRAKIEKFIDGLEDNDDVQEVYHNWEIDA